MYKNINFFSGDENNKWFTYPIIKFDNGNLCEYYHDLKDFKKNIELNFTN